MCGRFTIRFSWEEFTDELETYLGGFDDVGEGVALHPHRFNISPTQPIVVVWQERGKRKASLMRWGLVPTWVKDPSEFSLIINARMETIQVKPSFRGGLQHHRCLIPASGYYEWRTGPKGKKQPYYISSQDGAPMLFAGIYSNWMGASGEEVDTTAMITVPANPDLKEIHHRMPVIIPKEMANDWLNVTEINETKAFDMLRPAPNGVVAAHAVSRMVNSARNEGPQLVEPIDPSRDEATAPPPKPKSNQMDLF